MVTKLIKRTIEETVDAQDEIVEKVVAIEMAILDENEVQVGSAHISQHGVNISLYGKEYDIHDWVSRLKAFLNIDEEVVEE
jgi:DNA topoisomerase IB